MLVLRIFGVLLVITLGISLIGYVLTRDRQWLYFALRGLAIGFVISLIFMILYALERLFVAL